MIEAETRAEFIDPALRGPAGASWRQALSLPILGVGAGFLKHLQHTLRLAVRGTGIANTAPREVAHAGIQPIRECPWSLPADPLVHASHHPPQPEQSNSHPDCSALQNAP